MRQAQRGLVRVLAAECAARGRGGAASGAAEAKPALPLPDKPSIAVLPFDNLSGDARYERLADGLTEDIITDLSRFRDLFVIARNSTFFYKDKPTDVRQIARELGVRYVLEGSLQAQDERVRITAQLVDASTGNHVWSERYDRPLDDIFALQDEVTQTIVASLAGQHGVVAQAGREVARRKPPANLQAYELYLLGFEHKHRFTKEDNLKAQELARKAIELDPSFARAYVLYWPGPTTWKLTMVGPIHGNDPWIIGLPRPRLLLSQIPRMLKAHLTLGMYYLYLNNYARSLAEVEQALS